MELNNILQEIKPFIKETLLQCGSMAKEFRKNGIDYELKADGTKVTKADLAIQKFILDKLTSKYPDFRVTAEEILEGDYSTINTQNSTSDFRWIIDPIDGTSMFIQQNETYFGHAIALLHKNQTVFSAFYSPEHKIEGKETSKWSGIYFEASELENGIFVNEVKVQINTNEEYKNRRVILDNVKHNDLNTEGFKVENRSRSASLSLALLASGVKNSVVVFGNGDAAIWDVIPGAYLVKKSGGVCVHKNFENLFPLKEGKEILKLKGQIKRPVIDGEYFAGYENAVKSLLNFQEITPL